MYSFSYLEPVCCSMSSSNCCFLTCIRFLKRQVKWSGIPISFRIFHSLLWSIQSKALAQSIKQKIDVFLELSCFFNDPADVGNLISGFSAFSKSIGREEGSGWGTRVYLWWIHVDIWQNQYNIVKLKNKLNKLKKKAAWTSGSSRFTYCWSLAWRILSITLLAYEMNAIVW